MKAASKKVHKILKKAILNLPRISEKVVQGLSDSSLCKGKIWADNFWPDLKNYI